MWSPCPHSCLVLRSFLRVSWSTAGWAYFSANVWLQPKRTLNFALRGCTWKISIIIWYIHIIYLFYFFVNYTSIPWHSFFNHMYMYVTCAKTWCEWQVPPRLSGKHSSGQTSAHIAASLCLRSDFPKKRHLFGIWSIHVEGNIREVSLSTCIAINNLLRAVAHSVLPRTSWSHDSDCSPQLPSDHPTWRHPMSFPRVSWGFPQFLPAASSRTWTSQGPAFVARGSRCPVRWRKFAQAELSAEKK